MDEKKNIFKTIWAFIVGIATAITAFLFVRRRNISDNGNGVSNVREQSDRVGEGIREAERASENIAELIDSGTEAVKRTETELCNATNTANKLADSLNEQSERLRESKRIIDEVRARNRKGEN